MDTLFSADERNMVNTKCCNSLFKKHPVRHQGVIYCLHHCQRILMTFLNFGQVVVTWGEYNHLSFHGILCFSKSSEKQFGDNDEWP